MSNSCMDNNTSPFCTCQDYYGYILDEYKVFNGGSQNYNCCFNANTFSKPIATTGDDWLLNYAKGVVDPGCVNLVDNYTSDAEFKTKLPILYYQTYMTASLFSKFSSGVSFDSKKITCALTEVPLVVSYPNYHDENTNYKFLCASQNTQTIKNIKFIGTEDEIDYKVNYLKNNEGKSCTTEECDVKYDPLNIQFNIGDELYKSKTSIYPSGAIYSLWFWLISLGVILSLTVVFYFLYRRGMETHFNGGVDYLNMVNRGLGNTAKEHSLKMKQSYHNINS